MTHPRQIIRTEFARLLKAGKTNAGDNVSASRSQKVWTQELREDALSVYSLNENVETHSDSAPRIYKRTLQLAVEVWSGERQSQGTLVDDQVDDLCEQVECIVESNLTLPDCEEVSINPSLSRFLRTEIDVDEEGRILACAARMTWELVYYTEAPPTANASRCGNANKIGVGWDLQESSSSDSEAKSEIDLRSS